MSKGVFALFLATFVASVAGTARADDEKVLPPPTAPALEPATARFGARGQLVLLGGTTIGVSYQSYESNAQYLNATLEPVLDYFVAKNFAIGIAFSTSYDDSRGYLVDGSFIETKSSSLLMGPRVSYSVPIGRYVSFFPTAALHFGSQHKSETLLSGTSIGIADRPNNAASTTEADAEFRLSASLYFHPRSHVLLGVGPYFSHDFASTEGGPGVNAQATRIGSEITVGGYWGGERSAKDDEDDKGPHRRSLRKFGDAHEVVLTNAFVTNGSWTSFPSGSSAGVYEFALAADYFALPHFSIGANVASSITWGSSGVNATTHLQSSYNDETFGLDFRVGYQLALVDGVSIYPRASLGMGEADYDNTSASGRESISGTDFLTVGLYAPLDVEIAPHFFVGFGPSIARDLVTTTHSRDQQNRSTTVGAGAELGVWL